MSRFVSLRFRKLPVVHWHPESQLTLESQQRVVVRTVHGLESALVLRQLPEGQSVTVEGEPFVKEILRVMDKKDIETAREIIHKETETFAKAKKIVVDSKLPMRLLKAEYFFDMTRLILYYKSESKVDFRDLLKTLAGTFRTRIELRQIGVRDETKLLGGIGCCGKEVCCNQFMQTFHPVSTKMAKDQNLSLNPAKLSGICMRLLCCLAHEYEYYASFHGKYPKMGAEILVGTERARVSDINYITCKILVSYYDRRKALVPLDHIKGRKDPQTGRNLWWVQEPGQPEPDVNILLTPIVPPAPRLPRGEKASGPNDSQAGKPAGEGTSGAPAAPGAPVAAGAPGAPGVPGVAGAPGQAQPGGSQGGRPGPRQDRPPRGPRPPRPNVPNVPKGPAPQPVAPQGSDSKPTSEASEAPARNSQPIETPASGDSAPVDGGSDRDSQ